jgi:hypothetical protein
MYKMANRIFNVVLLLFPDHWPLRPVLLATPFMLDVTVSEPPTRASEKANRLCLLLA